MRFAARIGRATLMATFLGTGTGCGPDAVLLEASLARHGAWVWADDLPAAQGDLGMLLTEEVGRPFQYDDLPGSVEDFVKQGDHEASEVGESWRLYQDPRAWVVTFTPDVLVDLAPCHYFGSFSVSKSVQVTVETPILRSLDQYSSRDDVGRWRGRYVVQSPTRVDGSMPWQRLDVCYETSPSGKWLEVQWWGLPDAMAHPWSKSRLEVAVDGTGSFWSQMFPRVEPYREVRAELDQVEVQGTLAGRWNADGGRVRFQGLEVKSGRTVDREACWSGPTEVFSKDLLTGDEEGVATACAFSSLEIESLLAESGR